MVMAIRSLRSRDSKETQLDADPIPAFNVETQLSTFKPAATKLLNLNFSSVASATFILCFFFSTLARCKFLPIKKEICHRVFGAKNKGVVIQIESSTSESLHVCVGGRIAFCGWTLEPAEENRTEESRGEQRRTVAGGGSLPQTFHPHAAAAASLDVQTTSDETTDEWLPEV